MKRLPLLLLGLVLASSSFAQTKKLAAQPKPKYNALGL